VLPLLGQPSRPALALQLAEVPDRRAAFDEEAAVTERDHREDRQRDELPIAGRRIDEVFADRRLPAVAGRVVADGEPVLDVVGKVDPLGHDLAGEQRGDVAPGIAGKLQGERHRQPQFMDTG
jgi:hypothetical protein